MVQGRIVKNHSIILAGLPATETTSTTWTSCDFLPQILLRVNSALSEHPHTNIGCEPNSEIDMTGRFVPVADWFNTRR